MQFIVLVVIGIKLYLLSVKHGDEQVLFIELFYFLRILNHEKYSYCGWWYWRYHVS